MKRQLPMIKYTLKVKLKNQYGILLILILVPILSFAQTEFTTWGNITGIRVDNQLMEFNTSLIIIDDDNSEKIPERKGSGSILKENWTRKFFRMRWIVLVGEKPCIRKKRVRLL